MIAPLSFVSQTLTFLSRASNSCWCFTSVFPLPADKTRRNEAPGSEQNVRAPVVEANGRRSRGGGMLSTAAAEMLYADAATVRVRLHWREMKRDGSTRTELAAVPGEAVPASPSSRSLFPLFPLSLFYFLTPVSAVCLCLCIYCLFCSLSFFSQRSQFLFCSQHLSILFNLLMFMSPPDGKRQLQFRSSSSPSPSSSSSSLYRLFTSPLPPHPPSR